MRRCEDCRHSRCAVSMTPSLPDGGFIDTISVYVAGEEMVYDVPCEGVFYRMKGGSDGTD